LLEFAKLRRIASSTAALVGALKRQRQVGPLFFDIAAHFADFSAASGLGLSSDTSYVAGASPSHFGQLASSRTTGMWSCNSPMAPLRPQVRIVQLNTCFGKSPFCPQAGRDPRRQRRMWNEMRGEILACSAARIAVIAVDRLSERVDHGHSERVQGLDIASAT
jgi:hypothetical protein